MDKLSMREYLAELETDLDRVLKLWKKVSRVENHHIAQLVWQFNQSFVTINIFWLDGEEHITFQGTHPNFERHKGWHSITENVKNEIIDKVANFAMIAMHRITE